MSEEILKQWDLPKGAIVKYDDGKTLEFQKMDGMYAHWIDETGEMKIGNFEALKKKGDHYVIVTPDNE